MRSRRKGLAEEIYAAIPLRVSSPDRFQFVWLILWMMAHWLYIREAGMTRSSFGVFVPGVGCRVPFRAECAILVLITHRILLCTRGPARLDYRKCTVRCARKTNPIEVGKSYLRTVR